MRLGEIKLVSYLQFANDIIPSSLFSVMRGNLKILLEFWNSLGF